MICKTLDDYRGRHEGEDIFVFASGPSLNDFNMENIKGRPVICVNSSVMKYRNPTYFFSSDGMSVSMTSWKYVKQGNFPVLMSSQGGADHVRRDGGLQEDREVCFCQKKHSFVMDKAANEIVFGLSSAHCAAHFAVILGAARIILVGCECEVRGNVGYFFDIDGEEKAISVNSSEQYESFYLSRGGDLCGYFNYWQKLQINNPDVHIESFGGRLARENVFSEYKE